MSRAHKMASLLVFFLVGFLTALALLPTLSAAAPTESVSVKSPVLKENNAAKKSKTQLQLLVESAQYVSAGRAYFRDGASSRDATVGIHLVDSRHLAGPVSSTIDIKDEYSAEEKWNYFKPKEAYLGWAQGAKSRGAFGRKFETWSDWEIYWGQALFQPRYSENRLHPELVGLTGLFTEVQSGGWNASLAVLPIYIPEFGPHFSVQNDHFVSKNPWFHPPPANTFYNNAVGDVRYSVKADTSKILLNPGVAFRLESKGSWSSRASFAYKPMPQLLLGFPSFNHLVVTPADDYMHIEISPRVIYHSVASLETQTQWAGWGILGTSIFEHPDKDSVPQDWTHQRIQDALILGVMGTRALGYDSPRAPRLSLGVTKIWGGDAHDGGYFGSNSTLFERRYQYLEAYSVGLSQPLSMRQVPVEVAGRTIYDAKQNGGTFSLSFSAEFQPNLRATLSLDFIGLVNEDGQIKDGFLSTYRANDRVGLGLNYVY